jgi:hypothetical protein
MSPQVPARSEADRTGGRSGFRAVVHLDPAWTAVAAVATGLGAFDVARAGGWGSLRWDADGRWVGTLVLFLLPGVLGLGARPGVTDRSLPEELPAGRLRAGLWLAGAVLSLAAGVLLYGDAGTARVVAVELGGGGQVWPPAGNLDLGRALVRDYAFIVGYGTALWMGTTAATWVFWAPRAARLASTGRYLAVTAAAADVVENLLLTRAWIVAGPAGRWLDAAQVAATVKFCLLLPAAVVASTGIVVAAGRLASSRWGWGRRGSCAPQWRPGDVTPPLAVEQEDPSAPPSAGGPADAPTSAEQRRWERGYRLPTEIRSPQVGVCLSGGGIRSACVGLGFVDAMRGTVRRADYLVSVSGGGYTAGALAQLLTEAGTMPPGATPVRDPDVAYGPGTPEFDHLRRHASYLASTATEMLVALGMLARGLLASLVLLFGPAVPLGVIAAAFYHAVPVAVLPLLRGGAPNEDGRALWAIAVTAAVAALFWFVQVFTHDGPVVTPGCAARSPAGLRPRLGEGARRAAVHASQAVVVVAVVVIGIPVVVWVAGRLIALVDVGIGAGVGGSVGVVLLSYLASLAGLVWRNRTTVTAVSGGDTARKATVALPRGLLQLLLVIISVTALCIAWLLVFGVSAVVMVTRLNGQGADIWFPVWTAVAVTGVVAVVGGLLDETSLSLHPFYRARLAGAFATRTVAPEGSDGPVAVPYRPQELTALAAYAKVADDAGGFPEIIFAAAANLTGEHRTPAGLSTVSYTMSARHCGGPDVGWVATGTLCANSPVRFRRDLTVQGAVAISGAAIASAMGRFSGWYETLFAVSGARLGAWLPNPLFLARLGQARSAGPRTGWYVPGLPRVRRLTYLLRELFRIHPGNERLLQVTDGGHYENLGIVELLRRRCTTIYCVDGGGDTPPTAAGLAEAMALAQAELGVTIELSCPFAAEPGTGAPLTPQADELRPLDARLSRSPVLIGTIRFPQASGLPEGHRVGTLLVARALLWSSMPYPLLSYAAKHPEFPHDSTGDQWFDDGQFCAYTGLGRAMGEAMQAVVADPMRSGRCGGPPRHGTEPKGPSPWPSS